jgi:hypothetical protein
MVNERNSEEDETPVKEGGEGGEDDGGTDGSNTQDNPNGELRRWLECVNAVSEITKLNWTQVFDITILEFFAYLAFYNYRKRKEQQEIEAFRRKNKLKQ